MLISLSSNIEVWLGLGLIGDPGRNIDSLRGKHTQVQIPFSGDLNFTYI